MMKKYHSHLLLALSVTVLTACSTSVFHHKDPSRHVIVLDKETISVLQTKNNEWEAWGGGSARESTAANEQLQRQIKAIEIVSDCTVIKSTVDPDDVRRLSAEVRCKPID